MIEVSEASNSVGARLPVDQTAFATTELTQVSPGRRVVEALCLLAIALVAAQRGFPIGAGAQPGFVMFSDLPMMGILIFAPLRLRTRLATPSVAIAATLFLASGLLSWGVHPTAFGLLAVVRLVAVTLGGATVAEMVRSGRTAALRIVAIGWLLLQLGIAVVQRATGRLVGLSLIGESDASLRSFAPTITPSGTLSHRNSFAVLACAVGGIVFVLLLTSGRRASLFDRAALFAMGCSAGLALSRTATLSLVLATVAVVFFVVAGRGRAGAMTTALREWGWVIGGWVVAFGVQFDGWMGRGQSISTGNSADTLSSGRLAIMRQAIAIWRLYPVFGVGPQRYLVPVWTRPEIRNMASQQIPVHNYWLYILASFGAIGGIALLWLTGTLGARALRIGLPGVVMVCLIVPGLMLDVALFIWNGTFVLAACLGVICGVAARKGLTREGIT